MNKIYKHKINGRKATVVLCTLDQTDEDIQTMIVVYREENNQLNYALDNNTFNTRYEPCE